MIIILYTILSIPFRRIKLIFAHLCGASLAPCGSCLCHEGHRREAPTAAFMKPDQTQPYSCCRNQCKCNTATHADTLMQANCISIYKWLNPCTWIKYYLHVNIFVIKSFIFPPWFNLLIKNVPPILESGPQQKYITYNQALWPKMLPLLKIVGCQDSVLNIPAHTHLH